MPPQNSASCRGSPCSQLALSVSKRDTVRWCGCAPRTWTTGEAEPGSEAPALSAWSFEGSSIGGLAGNDAVLSPLVKTLQSRLERAEEQTRSGDRTKATALLRAAVDGATADLERKPTERTRAVRAVAAYQLATLLLQDSTTAKEGDELVWRLPLTID